MCQSGLGTSRYVAATVQMGQPFNGTSQAILLLKISRKMLPDASLKPHVSKSELRESYFDFATPPVNQSHLCSSCNIYVTLRNDQYHSITSWYSSTLSSMGQCFCCTSLQHLRRACLIVEPASTSLRRLKGDSLIYVPVTMFITGKCQIVQSRLSNGLNIFTTSEIGHLYLGARQYISTTSQMGQSL